jgi:hypothetical protein
MEYRINCDIYTPYTSTARMLQHRKGKSNLQFEIIIEFEIAQLAEQLPN